MARQFSPFVKDQASFDRFMNDLYGSYFRNAQAMAPRLGAVQQGTSQPKAPQSAGPRPLPPAPLSVPGAAPGAAPQQTQDAAQLQQLYKAYDPNLKARTGRPMGSKEYKDLVKSANELSTWLAQNTNKGIQGLSDLGQMEGGTGPTLSSSGYAYDPWTGKFTPVSLGVSRTEQYGPNDTSQFNYSVDAPNLERLMKRGAGKLVEYDDLIKELSDASKSPEFEKLYAKTQKAQEVFGQKYLPQSLRDQVAQFFPEKLDKGMTKFVGNRDYGINTLTSALASRGITDLSQLAVGKDAKGKNVVYDPRTGEGIHSGLWTFKGGSNDGNLQYYLKPNKEGTGLQIATHFEKPETRGIDVIDNMMPSIILAAAAGPAGAALGSALGAGAAGLGGTLASMGGQAIAQGVAGGLGAATQGGDIGRGLLTGAVGGALGGAGNLGGKLLGANAPAWQQAAINQGIGGAVKGGLGSYLTGQNIGKGILQGGASGALAGGLGGLGQQAFAGQNALTQGIGKVGTSALTSGLVNRIRGGDFMQGAQAGALGGLGGLAQQQLAGLGRQFGLDPRLSNQLGGLGSRFLMTSLMNRRG